MKYIVTTGINYTDIDGLACAIAYSELLKKKGHDAIAYLPGKLNASSPNWIREIAAKYRITKISEADYNSKFVLVDTCMIDIIDKKIPLGNIVEVIDHHVYGDEKYWLEQRKDARVIIESIGACATQIWREIKNAGFIDEMLEDIYILLLVAIYSNTLNFKALISNNEDKIAAKEIENIIFEKFKYNINELKSKYFFDVQNDLLNNFDNEVAGDAKEFSFNGEKYYMAQLELWDAKDEIIRNIVKIKNHLRNSDAKYKFFTLPMIKDGRNLYIAIDQMSKDLIESFTQEKFTDSSDYFYSEKLLLRKEIKKMIFKK